MGARGGRLGSVSVIRTSRRCHVKAREDAARSRQVDRNLEIGFRDVRD